jgi:hypothetical protein
LRILNQRVLIMAIAYRAISPRRCIPGDSIRRYTVSPFPIPNVVRWIGRRPLPFPEAIMAFFSSKYLKTGVEGDQTLSTLFIEPRRKIEILTQ